jgi:polyhydroxyalkanoate synthesis repressor PhaR
MNIPSLEKTIGVRVTSQKTKAAAPLSNKRIIKKYPNRRLYDTSTSSYITITEVKQLVMEQVSLMVIDAKTNEDLTRSILLQIILDQESAGVPMFTEQVLENIIRFYGHTMQPLMGSYLEKSIQAITQFQSQMTESSKQVSPELWQQLLPLQTPVLQGMMGQYAEQSNALFLQMQEQVQEQLQKQTDTLLSALGVKSKP